MLLSSIPNTESEEYQVLFGKREGTPLDNCLVHSSSGYLYFITHTSSLAKFVPLYTSGQLFLPTDQGTRYESVKGDGTTEVSYGPPRPLDTTSFFFKNCQPALIAEVTYDDGIVQFGAQNADFRKDAGKLARLSSLMIERAVGQHLKSSPNYTEVSEHFQEITADYFVQTGDLFSFVLVTPYLIGGDLNRYNYKPEGKQRGECSELQLAKIILDLSATLQYCAQIGIIHNDLNSTNIHLSPPNRETGLMTATLIDFGCAAFVENAAIDENTRTILNDPRMKKAAIEMDLGSLRYQAPERRNQGIEGLTLQSDWYSLGILLTDFITSDYGKTEETPAESMIREFKQAMDAGTVKPFKPFRIPNNRESKDNRRTREGIFKILSEQGVRKTIIEGIGALLYYEPEKRSLEPIAAAAREILR